MDHVFLKEENLSKDNKKEVDFMRRRDRKFLYSVVVFLGGILVMNMILPSTYEYKTIFVILGGLIVGVANSEGQQPFLSKC